MISNLTYSFYGCISPYILLLVEMWRFLCGNYWYLHSNLPQSTEFSAILHQQKRILSLVFQTIKNLIRLHILAVTQSICNVSYNLLYYTGSFIMNYIVCALIKPNKVNPSDPIIH